MLPQAVISTLKVIAWAWLILSLLSALLLFVDSFRTPQMTPLFPVPLPPTVDLYAGATTLVTGILTWAVLMALALITDFLWGIYTASYEQAQGD